MQKIVVADDGSTFARKARDKTIDLAKKEESEIVCVNVIEDFVRLDCQRTFTYSSSQNEVSCSYFFQERLF